MPRENVAASASNPFSNPFGLDQVGKREGKSSYPFILDVKDERQMTFAEN